MPDVKWYAGATTGTITISTTVVSGGTNNRLLRQTSSVVGNSLLSDDATNVTLTSGQHLAPNGTAALPAYSFANNPDSGLVWTALGSAILLSLDEVSSVAWSATYMNLISGMRIGWGASATDANASTDTAISRHAASGVRVTNGGTGAAALVIGTSSHPATPASGYLFIEGVSGAGGTPTTSHITAGSGVAIYTQQAHDAAATALVIAYNLSGSMRYVSIPLDGATATWTHNATRP